MLLGESIDHSGHLHVSIDDVAVAAANHLIAAGRRRVAVMGAHFSVGVTGPAERRLQGLHPGDLGGRPRSGARAHAAGRHLDALKALADAGVRVPEDVAVVGWDDIADAAYAHPTLTTVAPDKHQIATEAIDGLLRQLRGAPTESTEVTCRFELKLRRSSPPVD